MKAAHEYSKRILLAVSGMSPQIVTETLYALSVAEKDQPFIPTEIHLISTNAGKNEAVLKLLHPKTGLFHQLCKDYDLKGIQFSAEQIYVITNNNGVLLDDIKTPEENEAAADFITQKVNELTRDDDSALHVSIAGGRKTMGYYLGYALSLYGRAQDRLSHVLVTDRYESLRDFFYPTPHSHVIYDRDNKALDAQAAVVMLANIPFVRLRTGLPESLLQGKASFNESVRFARVVEAEPSLEIDRNNRCLRANGIDVRLTDINFAFYYWMIQETVFKKNVIKRPARPPYFDADNMENCINSFLECYKGLFGDEKEQDRTVIALTNKDIKAKKKSMTALLSDRTNNIKKMFEDALRGSYGATPFLVINEGGHNNSTYKLSLTQQQVSGFTPADCD